MSVSRDVFSSSLPMRLPRAASPLTPPRLLASLSGDTMCDSKLDAAPCRLSPFFVGVWLLALVGVWVGMGSYGFSTNQHSSHGFVEEWPSDSALVRHEGQHQLVLFMHPKCPCTWASAQELHRLLNKTSHKSQWPALTVVACVPTDAADDWHRNPMIDAALDLPQTQLFIDQNGYEAERFGAVTSGTVCYFDKKGHCCFAGGVTIARGHAGASLGEDILSKLITGKLLRDSKTIPVFGCRLCLPTDQQEKPPLTKVNRWATALSHRNETVQ